MQWIRVTGSSYDQISSGDYRIHRSLKSFTCYRVNPFVNFGLFAESKKAKIACENNLEKNSNGQNELLL